jgi:hypothetical protein
MVQFQVSRIPCLMISHTLLRITRDVLNNPNLDAPRAAAVNLVSLADEIHFSDSHVLNVTLQASLNRCQEPSGQSTKDTNPMLLKRY